MAQSPLLGTDRAPPAPAGRDTETLGPSDSSDSGSDVAGLGDEPGGDPNEALDRALDPDRVRPAGPDIDAADATDAAGTGERRSAGMDPGREGGDVGMDRVFDPAREGADHDDEDPDLDFVTAAEQGEVEDESADPVGDGVSDAAAAAAQPPIPGRTPPVEPDELDSDLPPPNEAPTQDGPDADAEAREPGRD